MTYRRRDVVWSSDPFKDDPDAGRPWLVVNNDRHPFADEQYVAVALTTSGYDDTLTVPEEAWVEGGTPTRSHVVPWAVHSPDHADVERRQGRLDGTFVERVIDALLTYVEATD